MISSFPTPWLTEHRSYKGQDLVTDLDTQFPPKKQLIWYIWRAGNKSMEIIFFPQLWNRPYQSQLYFKLKKSFKMFGYCCLSEFIQGDYSLSTECGRHWREHMGGVCPPSLSKGIQMAKNTMFVEERTSREVEKSRENLHFTPCSVLAIKTTSATKSNSVFLSNTPCIQGFLWKASTFPWITEE